MNIFKSYKDEMIEDCLATINRMNKELSERSQFEHKLIIKIFELQQELDDAKNNR